MRLLSLIGALGIVFAVCAAVFFFGGFFNIAATDLARARKEANPVITGPGTKK